ncbi:kinase-like protein [Delitschia confertaspora ATCC 74209]|uniref:ethanolamine kinase n=1 Tax=Delitschia confertaspora ATCC 74209 TaxID=1513339 RepID=A0A9P4MNT7_9PLEO|nr:kinase-like protein [Delitschia confertaspora ATCC 74209]
MGTSTHTIDAVRHIPLYYSNADSHNSALTLILALKPEWKESQDTIEFNRFKDGITNTLLKATNKLPGLSQSEVDSEAILLRAYGKDTDILIDREKETLSHSFLAQNGLAPPLLARFENGLLYKYIQGDVCTPADLRERAIWRGVARRLGEWHATLSISSISKTVSLGAQNGNGHAISSHNEPMSSNEATSLLTPGKPLPNMWTVMQKWVHALPTATSAEKTRQEELQHELEWLFDLLGETPGITPETQYVFAHCDLLSGNVIVHPPTSSTPSNNKSDGVVLTDHAATVSFIDYEYATAAPASFDLSNHFAEWGGLECDFTVLPTRSVRRAFLKEYLDSFNTHLNRSPKETDLDELFDQVDKFRCVPGLYWGIWALIQAQISLIDFDYATYAEIRLGEYFAWKKELSGERKNSGEEAPVRERRWAEE